MSFDEIEIFEFPTELKKSVCGGKNKKIRLLKKTTSTKIDVLQNDGDVTLLHITGETKNIQKALTKLKQSTRNARKQLRGESSTRLLINLSNSVSQSHRTEGEEGEEELEVAGAKIETLNKNDMDERENNNGFNTNDIDRFNMGENIQNDYDNSNKNKTIGFELFPNVTDHGKEGPFEIIVDDCETQTLKNFYTIENISDNCCKILEDIMNNDDNINPIDEKTLTKGHTLEKNSVFGTSDPCINVSSLEIDLENNYEASTPVDEMEKKDDGDDDNKATTTTTSTTSLTSNIIKILGAGLIFAGLAYYYKVNLKDVQKKQK